MPVPALSSAESELFSLVEGLKEGVALGLTIETTLWGMPKLLPDGRHERESGTMVIRMRSDSQAAINISRMPGLLGRARHLELRVAYLQYMVDSGRAELEFLPGKYNGSDCLTKWPDKDHLPLFLRDVGVYVIELGRKAQQWTDRILSMLEPLSG